MCPDIVAFELRGASRLHLRFADGAAGEVDIAEIITFDGVFTPLREQAFFDRVYLDPDWGTLGWPGNLDLAPEPLYAAVAASPATAAAQ
jgi:hypothetical protein